MLRMKDLPLMEREGNGSLYRMDAKQRREAVRLIRAHCSFYDNGNCLYLDDDEEVVCPQITSFSVICAFFRQVVLKDEAARGLEAKLFRRETAKRCRVCGRTFSSTSNNAKYCPDCRAAMQRRQKAAYARRRRANVEKSAYEKA